MDNKTTQLYVMKKAPLPYITPKEWLEQHNNAETEKDLADTYAGANNEAWWLDDKTYDDDCPDAVKTLCKEWFDLLRQHEQKLLVIAKRETDDANFTEIPQIKWLEPIMLRNGYKNVNGWWFPIWE